MAVNMNAISVAEAEPQFDERVQEFEQIAALPENADRRLEYIGGEIVEMSSNQVSTLITARIIGYLFNYLLQHDIGRLTTPDAGFMINNERYMPDCAFMSYARQPEIQPVAWNPIAPDLAVEVVSPTDNATDLQIKLVNYRAAGTTVWVVYPSTRELEVRYPDRRLQILLAEDTLDGGDVLPGFEIVVHDFFPSQRAPQAEPTTAE